MIERKIFISIISKISLLISCLTLLGCVYDPPNGAISIHNYSDAAIYVYATCSNSLPCDRPLVLFQTLGGGAFDAKGKAMKDTISPDYRINAYSYGSSHVWGSPEKPRLYCE